MLTEKQQLALAQLRGNFGSIDGSGLPMNDKTYLRYLRARQYDHEKASQLLQATLNWRHLIGLSDVNSWKGLLSKENVTGKMYCRGFDKSNRSILYMRPKLENTKDFDGNIKHVVYNMEKAIACMSARSCQEKIVLLIDFEGFTLSNSPPIHTSIETLNILQNHYPERLHKAYCIRPPWIFNTFWSMISPFIDPNTKMKIEMLHLPPEGIRKRLLEEIEIDVLESSLGGNDSRPFDSNAYLNSPLDQDFYTILSNRTSTPRQDIT